MSKKRQIVSILLVIFFLLAGCNLGVKAPVTPKADVATIVAATLAAFPAGETPQATPTLPPQPTATITASPTPTYSPPMLIFDGATNCRSGPGTVYPVLEVLQAGAQVDALGRYNENYWLVQPAAGQPCWVAGDVARPQGSVHLLPTVTPPPTPSPLPPATPLGLRYTYVCQFDGSVLVDVTWNGLSDLQGYRVYRDGVLLAELPPGSGFYRDTVPSVGTYRYEIGAFNGGGETRNYVTATITCQ